MLAGSFEPPNVAKLRLHGPGGKQPRHSRRRDHLSESEGGSITSSTVSPTPAAAQRERDPESRRDACLREAAARIAAALVRLSAGAPRVDSAAKSRVLTEHIVIGGTAYRVQGELLARPGMPPVVLVAIERHPGEYPSCSELRAAFRLTRAEARVATLLAERMSNREIARELRVSGHTARKHTERVLSKLGIHSRTKVRGALLRCMQRAEAALHSAREGETPWLTLSKSRRSPTPGRGR